MGGKEFAQGRGVQGGFRVVSTRDEGGMSIALHDTRAEAMRDATARAVDPAVRVSVQERGDDAWERFAGGDLAGDARLQRHDTRFARSFDRRQRRVGGTW